MVMIDINDFDFKQLENLAKKTKFVYYKKMKEDNLYYLNLPLAFDIETTSTMVEGEKFAFMYIWQCCIGDNVLKIYGRTWEDFIYLLNKIQSIFNLSEFRRAIMYVHNLGYEFQFFKDILEWKDVFATDERKPLKALTNNGIEFRDSYILSGMSLNKVGDNLINHDVKKMVGDLDYSLIRTHETPLTQKELGYCENDVVVLTAYIQEQIEMYGDIAKIPLTNTGRVRKFVGDKCYFTNKSHKKSNTGNYKRYRKIMNELQISSVEEYNMLKRSFSGGFTHANYNHVGKVLTDVASDDFTSSYPTVMLSEMFPMSRGYKVNVKSMKEFENLCNMKCVIMDLKFNGLISKVHFEHYLSESKCFKIVNKVVDNGRIVKADSLITTITNIDFSIIKQCYEWESLELGEIIVYDKGYLPKPIIESVLELYENKTVLKDVEGKEVEYMVSKGMINSTYGMCVTDIVQDNHTYENGVWTFTENNKDEQLEKYNKGRKRFLYYPWGVFITAYARMNLWTGILNIKDDYVYCDTDSIKYLNKHKHLDYFEKYNNLITAKLYKMCEFHSIDKTKLSPKTIKGVVKPIGVWDSEGTYSRFKTLGAKRYMVEQNGKVEITVAGLSKANGLNYMKRYSEEKGIDVFDMFNNQLYIPSKETGKMTHTYIDSYKKHAITDYLGHSVEVESQSGIHLSECDFTLSLSKEYLAFIEKFSRGEIFKGVDKTL